MRIIAFVVIFVCILSCKKEDFYDQTGAKLNFSTDTLSFDTIFTSFGTPTKRLMVYNPYNQSIKLSSIKLAKGDASPYVINVNGENNTEFTDISIASKDSLYVFVQMYLKNAGQDLPLFVKDSILFETNGSKQDVKLIAYAQDVNIYKDSLIKTQTWSGSKPYLIIGYVEVDTLQTLNIDPGVKVYFKRDANLFVQGRIFANGTFYNPIIFQQERTDDDYDIIPGQWGGIYLLPGSVEHQFNWVTIKNGTTGIMVGWDGELNTPKLDLNNVIIQNMAYCCLYAYNAKIHASNCLIANSKVYNCYFFGGGEYQFYHSTLVNYYSNIDNRLNDIPSLYLSNYYDDGSDNKIVNDLLDTYFRNCIIYGENNNELEINMIEDVAYNVSFDYCLIRGSIPQKYSSLLTNVIPNKDPEFKTPFYDFSVPNQKLNFELDTLSPAKDAGLYDWGAYYPFDLKNKSRTSDKAPDIGAYERIEK